MTEQTRSNGWAFLVARGRRQGYRSILVPDFLAESNEYGIIGDAVSGEFSPSGAPRIVGASGHVSGALTIAYQKHRLTYADLDNDSLLASSTAASHTPNEFVTDEHGRPIDLLYGFICRTARIREIHEEDLFTAHAQALYSYRRFLADETGFELEVSEPFILRSVISEPEEPSSGSPPTLDIAQPTYLPTEYPPPAAATPWSTRDRTRLNPVIVVVTVVIFSLIVWIITTRPPAPEPEPDHVIEVDVVVAEPKSDTVDCTKPVYIMFQGNVKANNSVTVNYHWEEDADKNLGFPGQIIFDKAGSKQVQMSLWPDSSESNITGSVKLVIDSPNDVTGSADYDLTCRSANQKDPIKKDE